MDQFPTGKTAIVGAATYGIGAAPGVSSLELAVHASLEALRGARLAPKDVDGLFVCLPADHFSGLSMAEYLGIRPRVTENSRMGGSCFQSYVVWAALALAAGQCDVALIAYGSNQRSAAGKLVSLVEPSPYQAPYRPIAPISSYALAASRHMHQFGTTREHLAEVAVAARKWAQLNPEAVERGELTLADCLNSRMISDPLTRQDCCLVTDGAAAIVLVREDRAKDHAAKPAYVLGAATASSHFEITSMPDLTVTPAAEAGARAYAQARMGPRDVDVVQLYDAFTINTILFLEDLGFCPKGEGGRFVEGGRIAPGGELPVNTNGGGLSCVHPGMYGLFSLVEATQQVTGTAGARQMPDVDVALSHGNGVVLSSEAVVILGSENTRRSAA